MFQSMRARTSLSLSLTALAALGLAACVGGGMKVTALATAKQVTDASELIGGPNAQGKVGDYLLKNDHVRIIIRGVSEGGIDGYGGTIVDMDRTRFPGEPGNDQFGTIMPIFDGTRTVRPQRVFVLDNGASTGTAIIRVEGEDAPFPGISPVQHAVSAGEESSLERNRPIGMLVKTDYILRPGARYVEIRTTFMNRASSLRSITVGDVIDYGSSAPFISAAGGFALPMTDARTNTVYFAGGDVSYAYHTGKRLFLDQIDERYSVDPVSHVLAYPFAGRLGLFADVDAIGDYVAPGGDQGAPKLDVPGGGSAAFTRYVLVGEGTSAEILHSIHRIDDVEPGYITGRVTTTVEAADGAETEQGLAGATVAILKDNHPMAYLKTNQQGKFEGAVAPGTYKVIANAPGYPYAATGTPSATTVQVESGVIYEVTDMAFPAGGQLRVFLRNVSPRIAEGEDDEEATPSTLPLEMPGMVVWERIGNDPSPDTHVADDGTLTLPFRPHTGREQLLTVGPDGAAALPLEPGEYILRGYAGPHFSMARIPVTVRAGANDAVLELSRVVRTESPVVVADFNARTTRSGQGQSERELILDALAKGVTLVVATDTSERTDLLTALRDLDQEFSTNDVRLPVSSRIAVATGEQVSPSGYGSFAAWPVTRPSDPIGAIQTQVGEDSVLPRDLADELAEALSASAASALAKGDATGKALVQIDRPFGGLYPASRLNAYIEAVDPIVDWTAEAGAISHGPDHVHIERAGLPSEELWTGPDRWTAMNILYGTEPTYELSLNTWFALLNLGYNAGDDRSRLPRVVATGTGEGQELIGLPAGHPRNHILSSISFPDFRNSNPNIRHEAMGRINDRLRTQQNVVSNAPTMRVTVSNTVGEAGMGEMLELERDETEITVTVDVETPCWAPVDQLALYANAVIEEPLVEDGVFQNPVSPVTTIPLNPVVYNARTDEVDPNACRADGSGYGRLSTSATHTFDVEVDHWIVPVVSGPAFAPALSGMRPLAIGNPVFVDMEGVGDPERYDAPCPGSACPNVDGTTRLGFR